MISDKYKIQLIDEAKAIDIAIGVDKKFESLVYSITEEQNELSALELIKELSHFSRMNTSPVSEKQQERFVTLLYQYLGAVDLEDLYQKLKETSNVSLTVLLNELNSLVGLSNVKQQVQRLIKFYSIQKLRLDNGLKKTDKTMHLAFLGNPGTGKTSVARIIGKMYRAIGCLSKGHFIEAGRTDLIAEYQGQTAIKVRKLINKAKGGVLFIDEAYSITENNHCDSYGRECLTELTKALEDYRDDLVVIVAGYTHPMEQFFESNPGLKSRFNNFVEFPDYNIEELIGIFEYICNEKEYQIGTEAKKAVENWLRCKLSEKSENFSNGRFVRNLFDEIITNQAIRLSEQSNINKNDLLLIEKEDIPMPEVSTTL